MKRVFISGAAGLVGQNLIASLQGVDIVGVDKHPQNLAILRDFKPLSTDQMRALRDQCKQFNDGRYELYKSTLKYDSDLGRSQHGYPSSAELPL